MNVALIGLKGHHGTVLQGLAAAGCRLVAVCDDSPEALAGVAGWPMAGPQTRTYTDYRDLLAQEPLDILCHAGVDSERAEVLVAGAQRGLHLIAEKPLANSLAELTAVREAVAVAGVELSMLLTMRFEPAYRAVRQAVAEGAIGEVCQGAMQKSYRLGARPAWQCSRATFSGIVPFIGIHALDLIRWCSGREFTHGSGFAANTGHPEIGELEDNACLALRLDNGGSAAARLDYCRPAAAPTHGDDRLRLAGSHGVIESLAGGTQVTLITADEGPRELPLSAEGPQQFVNFVQAIRGEAASEVPAADCFRMTEIVLKLRVAVEEGEVHEL
jgi:predicted dehydrogenase